MSVEEKVDIVVGEEAWYTSGVERLGIARLHLTDGPNGLRCENPDADASDRHNKHGSHKATCFPSLCLLAATFDKTIARKMGEQLGEEASHYGVDILLGPGVNHKRTPIGGRNFEYFSEDPILTSDLASAYINGVQSKGVGCSLKHYFGNNTEYNRFNVDVVIDERTLREIYLRSFQRIIKKSAPATVMAAYNRYHGEYCAHNKEALKDLLRGELEFKGVVISDWGAVHNRVEALKGGCDLEMTFDYRDSKNQLINAVKLGVIPESLLDESCERLLALRENYKAQGGDADFEKGYSVALETAIGGMVLLKNEGALPLTSLDFCVIGEAAKYPRYQGEGSSRVNAWRTSNPLTELERIFGTVPYARGYVYNEPLSEELIKEAKEVAQKSNKAIIFIANDDYAEEESKDRKTLALLDKHLRLIDEVSSVCDNVVVVLQTGGVTEMPYADKVKGIVQQYFAGEACGEAIAKLLSGTRNFSGRLPETYPIRYEDNPTYHYYAKEWDRLVYEEGIFTGYRYYDRNNIPVRYPFGWGLSYTSFAYSDMECVYKNGELVCKVKVTNTGRRVGEEILMLYVSKPQRKGCEKPVKELVAFEKQYLGEGETKSVTFAISKEDLSYWNDGTHCFELEKGVYRLTFYGRENKCEIETNISIE